VTLFDWRVLSLMAIVLLVLTVLVAMAPILGIQRLSIRASSGGTMSRASLPQRLAGTAQIAITGAFGGAAIAFAWYLGSMIYGDPGYELENRYLVNANFRLQPGSTDSYFVNLERQRDVIAAIPGVTAVAFGSVIPGGDEARGIGLFPIELPDPADPAAQINVYPGSFEPAFAELLGYRLIYGRFVGVDELQAVVVNQTMARRYWGHDDVVGERLPASTFWGDVGVEVVGVLADVPLEHPSAAPPPAAFSSLIRGIGIPIPVVEAELTAAELRQALDGLLASGSLEGQVQAVQSLASIRNDLLAPDRVRGWLTIVTAALVGVVAAFGFYGMQRYLVAAGRREYAIRASLGAGPTALGRLVVRRGLALGLPGLVTGVLLAFIAVAWLRSDYLSRQVSPGVVAIAVAVGLISMLAAASLGPARRARRTQPAPLLKED
jgi:hypothetical protein